MEVMRTANKESFSGSRKKFDKGVKNLLEEKTYSEFVVIDGSPLVGLKQKELEEKYGVEVKHSHNPYIGYETRKPYEPNRKIEEYSTIKVHGTIDNIRKLRSASVDFQRGGDHE